jgi:hypothetical protein
VVGSCEHDNKPSGSIKYGKFLDSLSDYYFFNECTPWSSLDNYVGCRRPHLNHRNS